MVTSWVLSEKEYALADQAAQVADLVLNGLLELLGVFADRLRTNRILH